MLMDVNMFVKWIFIEMNVFMDLFNGSERRLKHRFDPQFRMRFLQDGHL